MKLQRFNENGISRFGSLIRSLSAGDDDSVSTILENVSTLLEDVGCLAAVRTEIEVEPLQFTTRYEVGAYLYKLLGRAPITELDTDRGLWAWLAAFYFDQLCPPDYRGRRRPGELARWILAVDDFRKRHRHLLADPFRIYWLHRDHPRRALAVLANPPHQPGDIAEQLAARQKLIANPTVMEVATRLYINPRTSKPKRGAARQGKGGVRHLVVVLKELERTGSLHSLSPDQLLDLLPDEFDPFKLKVGH